jgi:xylan 1,4-beta-xylosidase
MRFTVACLLVSFGMLFQVVPAKAAEPLVLEVNFAVTYGVIRALHGVNKGPLGPGGLIDLTAEHRALGIPFTRLHDCYWPNPYVVDIHAVFPDFNADPARPENYDFRLTDEYLAAVRATGAEIVYRLGESIEHTRVKRFVHPPADYEKWAAICRGIIRHYNEGWAKGFRHGIQYWEIWNEPENRPAMWSGTDEDYFRLYRVTATAIRREFPDLKIGGPAVGASGRFMNGAFQPTDFVTNFLKLCRAESLPLDFFSWHSYTADPAELVSRAKAIRALLDEHGFTNTESHLNEWNYLPGNSWEPLSRNSPAPARQRYYEEMAGAPGAAFIASALIELQDAPLEVANLFHGELGAFGLFNEFGVPQKNYHALRAFRGLLDTPHRVEASGGVPGRLAVAAGLNARKTEARVLISNFNQPESELRLDLGNLPWTGDTLVELRAVDAERDFEVMRVEVVRADAPTLTVNLASPAIALVTLRPATTAANDRLMITSPANRLVFQRNQKGLASIPIAGRTTLPDAVIETRLVSVNPSSQAGDWERVTTVQTDGTFRGHLEAKAGWYTLELRARPAQGSAAVAQVERVGVGEVFIVVGHSVAQGGEINLPGSEDDRVNTIALEPDRERDYERTGEPGLLPALAGSAFTASVKPAPFGHGSYFWARFGELVARRENVPVLVLNAAFGGTSLEHWAKSARGEHFEHGFVRSAIRMPYVNLRNALLKYASATGVRALLADQGQNDAGQTDATAVFENYRTWVAQARKDLGHPELAVLVNRQTPHPNRTAIRQAQEQMIHEATHCFPGPDYDQLADADRYDRIHLSTAGAEKAAQMWAAALDAEFFNRSVPYQPR